MGKKLPKTGLEEEVVGELMEVEDGEGEEAGKEGLEQNEGDQEMEPGTDEKVDSHMTSLNQTTRKGKTLKPPTISSIIACVHSSPSPEEEKTSLYCTPNSTSQIPSQ